MNGRIADLMDYWQPYAEPLAYLVGSLAFNSTVTAITMWVLVWRG